VEAFRHDRPTVVNIRDRIPVATAPDAGRLDQILRFQDSLLLGEVAPADLAGRICQGTALLVGVAAVRLAIAPPESDAEEVASYGAGDFTAVPRDTLRRALASGYPTAHRTEPDGRPILSVPLRTADTPAVLQLIGAAEAPLDPEQVALARYAATLATVALRQAALRERLEHTDRTKSEALVTLSHDLRSPLNVLIGYTQLLLEDAYGPCTSEQREVLVAMERHTLELQSLLSGALDMLRLELQHGEPPRQEFAIGDVLRELCSGSLSHRVARGVQLAWHSDPALPPMRSDRFRIRQILQNLVDNALRFTTQGSVSIAATAHEGGVRVTVSDTGPGIGSADLPHLFELFRPGTDTVARGRGTGCGLYLVKRFSESLGGRVAVETAPGMGTRFTIDFPLGS